MTGWESRRTDETRSIEELFRQQFPNTPPDHPPAAYRYNLASIRVRLVDSSFRGKSRTEREEMVYPIIEQLPETTQDDITILLLLTPEEAASTLRNMEFEHPTPSRLPILESEPVT